MQNGPKIDLVQLDNSSTKEPAKEHLDGNMCFAMEWYRERVPHEYEGGQIMSKDRGAESKKEDVLIFADTQGICPDARGDGGFMWDAPQDRVGFLKVITTPAAELTEEEMRRVVNSRAWDIIVWGYSAENAPRSCTDVDVIIKLHMDAQRLLLALSKHLLTNKKCNRLVVLTQGAHSVEPREHEHYGLGLVTHANMIGYLNSIRFEFAEQMRIQYVDCPTILDWPEKTRDIMSEIFREEGFGTNNVRINPMAPTEPREDFVTVEGRFVQRMVTSKLYEERKFRWLLPKKGVILITGGNGSLAMIMGKWLQAQAEKSPYNHPVTILFVSRSMKISPGENQKMWDEIKANATRLGQTVEQVACDFGDKAKVHEFLAQHSPNIVGIIHSAGVLRDSTLRNQTWEKYQEVYGSKSHAALYIHEALMANKNPDLYFYWMFSSIAVHGSMGQSNYAASNAMLDGIARHRRAIGLPGTSIQWGAWGEAGMAANMDKVNRRRVNEGPMPYFTNREGLKGLEAGLLTDLPTFSVFKYNIDYLLGAADVQPESAMQQFMQNQTQKIAAPMYLDQCCRIAFQRNMTMPSKMLVCPKFTYNEYPKIVNEPWYDIPDGYFYP